LSKPAQPRPAPRLYLITDRHAAAERPLADVVAAALRGIPPGSLGPADIAVQLREKDLSGRALFELALALRAVTAAAGAGLYINDRVDVALAVGADGVHLGGGSLDAATVARVAPALAIGVSVHAPAEVAALCAAAGDRIAFALLGPIHDTPSKRRYGAPLGVGAVTAAARSGIPVVAVGGIEPRHVHALRAAGAHGIACIRAVMAAADPSAAANEFCNALNDFGNVEEMDSV
jgi:thiamine-phosphate pyrophosphorylase